MAALAGAVMHLIDHGHRQVSRRIDLTKVQILGLIADRGALRPGEIAAELGLTASATSRHLTALEESGQIVVEADPGDARTFLVRQTDAGRAHIDATVDAGTAVFAQVVADWSEEDVRTARELIERLNEAWARRDAQPPPARRRRRIPKEGDR